MGRKIFMKYVCLGYLEPRKFEKAGGGGLVLVFGNTVTYFLLRFGDVI
jgi:hypothetical protein